MTLALRLSSARWRQLSALLVAVERGVDASARLDAHQAHAFGRPRVGPGLAFDRRLCRLEARIDYELDRLTAERLRLDLDEKQSRRQVA